MRILCIGDSNTWGYDPRSFYGSRYCADVRWTDRLGNHTVMNCGINGLAIPDNNAVYRELIRRKNPDLTIVMLGSNDLLEGASAAITTERMNSFLIGVRDVTPAILLISPPSMQWGEWVQNKELIRESKNLGVLYKKMSENLNIMFADADDWQVRLAFDGIHFTEEGHASFADGLNKLLGMYNSSLIDRCCKMSMHETADTER